MRFLSGSNSHCSGRSDSRRQSPTTSPRKVDTFSPSDAVRLRQLENTVQQVNTGLAAVQQRMLQLETALQKHIALCTEQQRRVHQHIEGMHQDQAALQYIVMQQQQHPPMFASPRAGCGQPGAGRTNSTWTATPSSPTGGGDLGGPERPTSPTEFLRPSLFCPLRNSARGSTSRGDWQGRPSQSAAPSRRLLRTSPRGRVEEQSAPGSPRGSVNGSPRGGRGQLRSPNPVVQSPSLNLAVLSVPELPSVEVTGAHSPHTPKEPTDDLVLSRSASAPLPTAPPPLTVVDGKDNTTDVSTLVALQEQSLATPLPQDICRSAPCAALAPRTRSQSLGAVG